MNFDELYRDVILDHHQNPRGAKNLHQSNADSSGVNPTCGDDVTVRLLIVDDQVKDIEVQGHGCAISTASGSMFAERAKGMRLDELKQLTETMGELLKTGEIPADQELGDMEALAGVSKFPIRVKCAMLPLATAKQAIEAFEQKRAFAATVTTEE
jgi:nitrogen fixation NifU-like protein